MELNSSNIAVSDATIAIAITKESQVHRDRDGFRPKKKRGLMRIIKAALYMLTHKKTSKSNYVPVDCQTASQWKKLVGCMRPLHLQSHQPPPRLTEAEVPPTIPDVAVENMEVFTPPMSPAHVSSASSSSGDISQYASAQNLQNLDKGGEKDGQDGQEGNGLNSGNDKDGDEMIDVKAELFIAQFYEQMRLQREAEFTRELSLHASMHAYL